ncbi:hypothetical protein BY458DRAFT_527392 [Sporodiniella umbellata]|nr:hypothetical protein BY458DRAFT_527392 [Sporodiniella umbellata]
MNRDLKVSMEEQHNYSREQLPLSTYVKIPTPVEPNVHHETIPTELMHWSPQENALYADAVKMHGYGNWQMISTHVQTRSPLQCQMHNHQIIQEPPRLPSFSQVSSMASFQSPSSNETMRLPPASSMVPQVSVSQNIHPGSSFFTSMEIPSIEAQKQVPQPVPELQPKSPPPPPTEVTTNQEHIINEDEITENERTKNPEWFMGKSAKTPERYKRIRNHIISCWRTSRPHYLTKTAGRKNLSDCGDVNAVGRIHTYLESIRAINVNCVTPPAVKKRSVRKRLDDDGEEKKRKKKPGYYWEEVPEDSDDKDHKPKSGSSEKRDSKVRPKRNVQKREGFYGDSRLGYDNDPFTLVPVAYYTQTKEAPFAVEVGSDVLLVMEFHAHLAYTEIIGLLGGRFLKDEEGQSKLKVEYVFPCRSASTGTQCEMDPDSEIAARELFQQKGLDVVGWYHSHPTFEPQPSIRDIENQTSYQDLFRVESSGDEPFIGFIISPYNLGYANDRSQIQCLHISKRWNASSQYRLPFACIQQIDEQKQINPDVLTAFLDLLQQYKDHENKIDMRLTFGYQLRLDKLVSSLRVHLHMSSEDNEEFLNTVREMVQQHFIQNQDEANIQHTDGVVESLTV